MLREEVLEVLEVAHCARLRSWVLGSDKQKCQQISVEEIRSLLEAAWQQGYALGQQESFAE